MARYPFAPALLDALPEKLAELFRGLEDTLLDEICSRLSLKDQLNEVTVQAIRALRSHGIDTKEIERAIRNYIQVRISRRSHHLYRTNGIRRILHIWPWLA